MMEPNPNDQPQWIEEYERRYRQTYLDIMSTMEQRNKEHRDALDALRNAVGIVGAMTIDFMENHMQLGSESDDAKEDSKEQK